jgi:aspartyl protease/PDZ domain-containing protein
MASWLASLIVSIQLLITACRPNGGLPSGNLAVADGSRSPSKLAQAAAPPKGASTPMAGAIPFQLNANKVFVQVRINSAGPFWFILDSGAIFNALDKDRAQALGMKLHGSLKVRGVGEASVDATHASGVSLEFGGMELKSQDMTVVPINSSLSHSEGHQIDGLLGYEFIRHYCIEIDYHSRVLNVYAPGACTYARNGQIVPLEIENNALYVSGMITVSKNERVKGRFLVDTAVRTALALNTPFVESNNLLARAGQTIKAVGVGIGGKTSGMVGRLAGLQLGSLFIKEPVVTFSDMKDGVLASGNFSGIIGGDILRRFKVILDCSGDRLILYPDSNSQESFEYDMSGLSVSAEGKNLNTFRVLQVMDHSPGSEAGVLAGDAIEAVDGHAASDLTLEQISQLLKHGAGETHELLLKRGQEQLKTTITLRRLV